MIKMGKVISSICKHDPAFRQRLDLHLLSIVPNLPEAERGILSHSLSKHKISWSELEKYLRVVLKAIDAVPAYSIESTRLTKSGRRDRKNRLVLSWSAVEIARDRFGYLPLLVRKKLFG